MFSFEKVFGLLVQGRKRSMSGPDLKATVMLQKKIATFAMGHQKQVLYEDSSTSKFSLNKYVHNSIPVS